MRRLAVSMAAGRRQNWRRPVVYSRVHQRAGAVVEDRALSFISERIEPFFDEETGFEKRPLCPSGFEWRGDRYRIEECSREWKDYARRGKMAHNMRTSHLATAEKRGSRGVGRYYFRVRTDDGRVFDLYYDRAPRDTQDRKGSWHLLREMECVDEAGLEESGTRGERQP